MAGKDLPKIALIRLNSKAERPGTEERRRRNYQELQNVIDTAIKKDAIRNRLRRKAKPRD